MKLHHIGFVVGSIAPMVERFASSLAASWDGQIIYDPIQMSRVAFLTPGRSGEPLMELIEPAEEKSPVAGLAKRGGGLHHLCYEVDSLEAQIELTRSQRGVLVKAPAPAVAFQGRRIAWVYTADRLLLEYLERS